MTVLFLFPVLIGVAWLRSPEAPATAYLEPEPDPALIESVILMLGDAGEARAETHPILPRLEGEVERWAATLEGDSSVVVLLLGDIVYPDGVAPPESPFRAEDSARVAAQAALVAGPVAAARGARAVFLAGNHDWGERRSQEGEERLRNLQNVLAALRASGLEVELLPAAGSGGPAVLDVGARLRLVMLDTAWWLLTSEPEAKDRVILGVAEALRSAEDRTVVLAAHHPFTSGGPHGGLAALSENLGMRALLSRAGALLQDLHSRPYRELRIGLLATFRENEPPALFAGVHEHSLQLLRGAGDEPAHTVV
jgi:3',5'-cyclic AMP phosphodiesterase CpdA